MTDNGALVQKQDGSLEVFCSGKLRRCVEVLLRETGFDPDIARALTKAVGIHVRQCSGNVSTTYIGDCVVAVLKQTGLSAAADALTAHRERRDRRRSSVGVVVRGASATAPWSKSRLAVSLRDHHDLREAVARYLAGEIERKVFELNYTAVSTELLSALVASELSAWGLTGRQHPEHERTNRVAAGAATASSRQEPEDES
jgi:hypothetical protein